MRETGNGWEALPTRGDAYAVGERVFGAIDGLPGTVVSVSHVVAPLVVVQWADENAVGDVIYPQDTILIRKAWPWE